MSDMGTSPGTACVLLRVWLPDRPGALGAVASRIGAVRADIVGIDVLERNGGVAIDEFGVVLADPALLPLLVREVEEVDGCRVEHVTVVAHFPDPRLDALTSVAVVCEADDAPALQRALAAYAGSALRADWAAVMAGDRVLADYGNPPADNYLAGLAPGATSSPASAGLGVPADLAVAPLEMQQALLLVGRTGNEFRERERAQLLALARIADHVWRRLDPAPPVSVGDADPAARLGAVAGELGGQVEPADALAALDGVGIDHLRRDDPGDLELEAVGVLRVEALRRAVVAGSGQSPGL